MKLLIDRDYINTRIETDDKRLISYEVMDKLDSLTIKSTPYIVFQRFTNCDLRGELNGIENDDIATQFERLRDFAVANSECFIENYPDFVKKVKKFKFDLTQYQKITYEIEYNENIDDIFSALSSIDSFSLFSAIRMDRAKNHIVSYSLRSGFWRVDDNLYMKKLDARNGSNIRTQYTKRLLTDITQVNSDFSRTNFVIYEDLNYLFKAKIIDTFKKSIEDIDGNYIDDVKKNYIVLEHFMNKDSSEDEQKEIKLAQKIKEAKRLNSSRVKMADVQSKLSQNREIIHINYEEVDLKSVDEVLQVNRDSYISAQIEDFKRAQEEALEIFNAKLKDAVVYEKECYKEYLNLIYAGANFDECRNILKARKFLDRSIMFAEELLKADIVKLSKIDLVKYNNYDKLEKANRTNYKNYLGELGRRKELESDIVEYSQLISDQRDVITIQNRELSELNRKYEDEVRKLQNALKISLDKIEEYRKESKES